VRHAKFSLRALLLFTAIVGCFLALNRVAWPQYALIHYVGPLTGRCLKQHLPVNFGWPAIWRTDHLAEHPPHETGKCRVNSTYYLNGLTINTLVACAAASVLTFMIVYLPPFISWQCYLRRERQMIDRVTARE
jgi:hypothetical protein